MTDARTTERPASVPAACDVLVVGAGPAGLVAATHASQRGLAVVLVDEQASPGGQVYRGIEARHDDAILGADFARGMPLVGAFRASAARYVPRASVWSVTPCEGSSGAHAVGVSCDGAAHLVRSRAVILATGAHERPFPIPGWTLPGVITAGAAQVLLKGAQLVPDGRAVLAGTGPLLWLLAAQLVRAGAPPVALLDTTPADRWRHAWRGAPAFLASSYARKGQALVREVRDAVRLVSAVDALAADGDGQLRRVRYRTSRREESIDADLLMLHQGVIPGINLSNAIGCAHAFDELQHAWRPVTDGFGATNVAGIWIAGDGAGIDGAAAAEAHGALAALDVARVLGVVDARGRDRAAQAPRRALRRARRGRRFLDLWFAPPAAFRAPADATIVCRCEEVTAGEVRTAIAQGCTGPNQLKAFVRCGMGPCQGRLCGPTVVDLIAAARDVPPRDVGYYRLRFPVKPLTLGELAAMPQTAASRAAVVRPAG